MDPKMDSGMESCGYQSIDEVIEDDAAPVPLSADSTRDIHFMINIMDHLLSCENYSCNLQCHHFSCIWARTNEEEDIFIMSRGLPLKGEGDDKCLTLMNAVEETISHKLGACKALSSKRKGLEGLAKILIGP